MFVQESAVPLTARTTWLGWIGLGWGVGGMLVLLSSALWRLTPVALEPLRTGLEWPLLALYVGWMIVNAYAEGIRGFQRSFSPRFAARAQHLARYPTPLRVALAPMFCVGLFHARRRTLIAAWVLLIGISLLVWFVRSLEQPWRGIIDGGVVVGLGWGLLATVVEVLAVTWGGKHAADPQLPAAEPR